MTAQVKKAALARMALGVLMGFSRAAARADDTAEENRQLKERVKQLEAAVAKLSQAQKDMEARLRNVAKAPTKQLEAKVDKLAQEQKQTEAQVRGIANAPKMPDAPPPVGNYQPCPPPPPPVAGSFTNGPKVDSSNGVFSLKLGGRLLVPMQRLIAP
jgi:DNA repair exonuclease SbcCD ATPase subunit